MREKSIVLDAIVGAVIKCSDPASGKDYFPSSCEQLPKITLSSQPSLGSASTEENYMTLGHSLFWSSPYPSVRPVI
jgi:hypothetical protein